MAKPRFFYRFRPVNRLPGEAAVPEKLADDGTCLQPAKAAIPGELEESYIFASTPESLNDPFEGYTKFYWSGDEIVWANLFRHYVHAIASHEFCRILGGEPRPIPLVLSRSGKKFAQMCEEITQLILADEIIKSHVQELAHEERKVSKEELLYICMATYLFITDKVFFVFAERSAVPEYKPLMQAKNRQLSTSILAAQKYNRDNDSDTDRIASDFIGLLNKYKASCFKMNVIEKQRGEQRLPFIDFPTCYIEQLPTLTLNPWYVACFMSSCRNSAIWGSYGDNHKGVCLIYDTILNDEDDPCLMLTIPWDNPDGFGTRAWRAKLQEVEYNSEPVELNFFENLCHLTKAELDDNWLTNRKGIFSTAARGYGSHHSRDKYWDDLDKRLTRKWKDWADEREYRIVYNPALEDASSPDYRKLKYEFSALKGICFGLKTSFEDICLIIDLVITLCDQHGKTEFEFHQVFHHSVTNSLEMEKVATLAEIKEGKSWRDLVSADDFSS